MVFRTLSENGSTDFAHFAYLDRSYQYLQLLYWHQVLKYASWHGFRPLKLPKMPIFTLLSPNSIYHSKMIEYAWNSQEAIIWWPSCELCSFFTILTKFLPGHALFWKLRFLAICSKTTLTDFAYFAYLDRSYQYLQLLYWHQVLENASWHGFRHFCLQIRPKLRFFALLSESSSNDFSQFAYLVRS